MEWHEFILSLVSNDQVTLVGLVDSLMVEIIELEERVEHLSALQAKQS